MLIQNTKTISKKKSNFFKKDNEKVSTKGNYMNESEQKEMRKKRSITNTRYNWLISYVTIPITKFADGQ